MIIYNTNFNQATTNNIHDFLGYGLGYFQLDLSMNKWDCHKKNDINFDLNIKMDKENNLKSYQDML